MKPLRRDTSAGKLKSWLDYDVVGRLKGDTYFFAKKYVSPFPLFLRAVCMTRRIFAAKRYPAIHNAR